VSIFSLNSQADIRSPGASTHLLIIPRYHLSMPPIETTADGSLDSPRSHSYTYTNELVKSYPSTSPYPVSKHIVRQMALLGTTLTQTQSESRSPEIKMGFHIPPFSSVHHLHLHVLVPPYNLRGKLKYPVSHRTRGEGKGWGWFVSVDQVLSILENGQKVGLGSSASPSSNSNTSTSRQRSA
jgi:hypothetical protein